MATEVPATEWCEIPFTPSLAPNIPKDEPPAEWQVIASRKWEQRNGRIQDWQQKSQSLRGGRPTKLMAKDQWTNAKAAALDCEFVTQRQLEISETLPTQLLHKLHTGQWSAEEVLQAFISRAVVAHYLTNPLSEVLFDQGLKRARELDEYLSVNGKPVGPLHGLPISLKDVFHLQGIDTTKGYVALVNMPSEKTDDLITKLGDIGAVFYCKTTVPQSLMSAECNSFIFGRTTSAYNTTLTAGGSSGGEGSLISLGGSPLGIGTDISGSLRTPAQYNGIYTLCPSYGRFPLYNAQHCAGAQPINSVAGPMSRSLDGLELYAKTVLSLAPWEWDESIIRMPWDQALYEGTAHSKRLCIGLVPNDSIMTPHPPIQRAMRDVKSALVAAGHIIVDLPFFFEAEDKLEWSMYRIFAAGGGQEVRDIVSKYQEPLIKEIVVSNPDQALSWHACSSLAKRIRVLRQKYHEKIMATKDLTGLGKPVDILIMPSGCNVAYTHTTMDYFLYEGITNLFDWTGSTIPVDFVSPELDSLQVHAELSKDFQPLSKSDGKNWEAYNPSTYENAPICLQVMGQRHTEEKVLGALRVIEKALGRSLDYHV